MEGVRAKINLFSLLKRPIYWGFRDGVIAQLLRDRVIVTEDLSSVPSIYDVQLLF